MVAAGEAGGILDTIFQRLSGYIEKAVKLKRAVQSAMVYPIAVVVIAGGVITLILWKVVPAFTELFNSMEVALPLPTRIVIGASQFVGSYGIFIFIGLGILGCAVSGRTTRRPKGVTSVDRLMLKTADLRAVDAQDCGRPVHAYDGNADRQRRADPGLSGYYSPHFRQCGYRGSDPEREARNRRGPHDCRTAAGSRRCSRRWSCR